MSATSKKSPFATPDSTNASPYSQHHGYPFPKQDIGSASRRHQSRSGSIASISSSLSNTSASVGGALDIQHSRSNSTVTEDAQNAIAKLLQPSSQRRGPIPNAHGPAISQRAPTFRDITPVTLTTIPRVDPTEFDDYCKKIGPLFEAFKRGRTDLEAANIDGSAARKGSESAESLSRDINDSPHTPSAIRRTSATTLSPSLSAHHRRRSSTQARRKLNEPPPLSTIPHVYFDQDFHLENPRIFDVVSERAEIIRPTDGSIANGTTAPPRKSLASNAILQEKLSWYMDTVEVHLVSSISSASASFFAALGSLKTLQQEAAASVVKIKSLRADLAALDKDMAQGNLTIARMRQRRTNVGKLVQATRQLELVIKLVINCEGLADDAQYDAAANILADLEHVVCGEGPMPTSVQELQAEDKPTHFIDLRQLKAMQGLVNGMLHLQTRIGKGYESRFMEALLSDLRRHVDKVPREDTLRRWSRSFQRLRGDHDRTTTGTPAYLDTDPKLRDDLLATLHGLHRAGHIAQAAASFQTAVMKEMKSLIRKHLPSSSNDDAESTASVSTRAGRQATQQERSTALARNLRALDDADGELLLMQIYTSVSEATRRLGVQIKILLDVTSSFTAMNARSPSSPSHSSMSPLNLQTPSIDVQMIGIASPIIPTIKAQEDLSQALDMSSLLGQAVDVVQIQISRVLKVRAEQTHALSLERFVRYYTLNKLLADECEAISGRSGQVLKNIVSTQLNAYVQAIGDSATQEIAKTLDADQWEAKDFTEGDNTILARIVLGMEKDVPDWTRGIRVWEDFNGEMVNGTTLQNNENGTERTNGKTPKSTKPAYIDETRYNLVKGAIAVIPIIDRFLATVSSMPSTAPIAIAALAEVLRTFNSRTSQLILGAGATRVAGLKNITTKHLALASQALSFVIALTPYVREGLRRYMVGKADALAELDRVKRLYQDHQMAIHDKLVDIMTARASAHIKEMKRIDFDDAKDGNEASSYVETLCRETATLHRVLDRHLAAVDVIDISTRIFGNYKEQWTTAFVEVEVKTASGKARLIRDIEVFSNKLGKIDGFGDIGQVILERIKAKSEQSPEAANQEAKDVDDENEEGETFFSQDVTPPAPR